MTAYDTLKILIHKGRPMTDTNTRPHKNWCGLDTDHEGDCSPEDAAQQQAYEDDTLVITDGNGRVVAGYGREASGDEPVVFGTMAIASEARRSVDMVNHPPHYGGEDNPYEAIKVIEAWDLNFNLGNAVKYISRVGRKNNDPVEDLRKAVWYLNREIEHGGW